MNAVVEQDGQPWTEFFEGTLSTVLHRLREDRSRGSDDTTRELLISNMNVLKKCALKLTRSMEGTLIGIVDYCACECYSLERSNDSEVSRLLDVIEVIFSVINSNLAVTSIANALSESILTLENSHKVTNPDNEYQYDQVVNTLRLIDALLTHFLKYQLPDFDVISIDDRVTLENSVFQLLLSNEPKLITYLLSIIRYYYRLTRSSSFIRQVWEKVVRKLLEDESYIETCLTVLSHLIRLEVELEEKSTIADSAEFWIALKKCFQRDTAVRKRALPVLKFVLSSKPFRPECCAWWSTYFVIADSLDEKQPHLVVPALKLMKNLRNRDIQVDEFWILNLMEQAMMHDSRAVRLEAFAILFEWDAKRFTSDHLPILVKMLRTCNDSLLFRKVFLTRTFDAFKSQLIRWANDLSSTSNGNEFVKLLFDDIVEQKWSPIPLYYVLEILFHCSHPWPKFICDQRVKTFMTEVTHSHNIVVRNAVQVSFLRILLGSEAPDFDTVLEIFELLNFCHERECLRRGTRTWSDIVDLVRTRVDFTVAETWLATELSQKVDGAERSSVKTLRSLARNITFLHDALDILAKSSKVREYFSRLRSTLKRARSDPYSDLKSLDNFVKLTVRLLQYGISTDAVRQCECVDIVTYVLESCEKCGSDSKRIDFYASCLSELISCETFVLDQNLVEVINEWLLRISRDLSLYQCAVLTQWVCELPTCDGAQVFSGNWRSVIDQRVYDHVQECGVKSFILDRAKNAANEEYSAVLSSYVNTFWKLFGWCSKDKREYLHECFSADVILGLVLEALQLARNENLTSIFRALEHIFRNENVLNDEASVRRVIDDSWKRAEEIQATPYYESAVYFWIVAFVQESVLRCKGYHDKVEYCIKEFMKKAAENGEQTFRSVNAILRQLAKIQRIHLVFPPVVDILLNVFCITHISRKDQRIEHETMNRVRLQLAEYLVPEAMDTNFVFLFEENRLRALNLILQMIREDDSLTTCVTMVETLTRTNDSAKKRYFGDSSFHRMKHKQLQLLLVLEHVLHQRSDRHSGSTKGCYENLYTFAERSLLGEPHQPSIRYMLEWLLVRIVVHRFSEFEGKFWSSFAEASEERIGSICSFIMVAFHLANTLKCEQFVKKAVQSTLPWSMAQHFNARLYAQSVLAKLMDLNENVKKKYQVVETTLASCLQRGNAVKNSIKLQEDFYFSRFHPEEHFTLQTILWELPRLSNISRDEWIQPDLFNAFLTDDYGIRLYDESSTSLSVFECSSWIAKASQTSNEGAEVASDSGETQKKFIPEDMMTSQAGGQRKRGQLVVVASLIDRMPNLGGLTRTCEIFAVAEMVLDSLDVVRNKEFTSLSITAEKHVPMVEVKRHSLFAYLKTMKEKRYCIVGVEQATNSHSLDNFTFPTKSIIVLGNEKEGIPADLLPVLDVCVEIPQVGVIRSLNVHVSASLIIWEYAKQHIFTS